MAISLFQSDGVPKTLLHIWREISRTNIWHFNQAHGSDANLNTIDAEVAIQPDRDTINEALLQSYDEIQRVLGHSLIPQWWEEVIPLSLKHPYQTQTLTAERGYIQEFGQRATTLIEAGAAIVFSTSNASLTVDNVATITVTDADAAADEVQIFFAAADQSFDGNGVAGDVRYQIAPATVTKAGNTITITCHRALLVKPDEYWDVAYTGDSFQDINRADTATAGHFVTTVDVYRVYTDTTTKAQLESDPIYYQATGLETTLQESAEARIVDKKLGVFTVRRETSHLYEPQQVRVYYKAGYDLVNGKMDHVLANALFRNANSIMAGMPLNSFLAMFTAKWERDSFLMTGNQNRQDSNPLSIGLPTIGQDAAWKAIRNRVLPGGGKLTHSWRG